MDSEKERIIKVLARFTNVGEQWPDGAWIYYSLSGSLDQGWVQIQDRWNAGTKKRFPTYLSELEANQRGIFRPIDGINDG